MNSLESVGSTHHISRNGLSCVFFVTESVGGYDNVGVPETLRYNLKQDATKHQLADDTES